MTDLEIIEILKNSVSKSDAARKCGWQINGTTFRRLKHIIEKYNVQCNFLSGSQIRCINKYGKPDGKYKKITKECPICNNKFTVKKGEPKEKTVCSHACANIYFRSGENNPNYKHGRSNMSEYRHLCKNELKCHRCGYNEFTCGIDIHHKDKNRNNNDKSNLIPLCAPCHRALHSNLWNISEI